MARRRIIDLNHRDLEKILKQAALKPCMKLAEQVVELTGIPENYEIQEDESPTRARVTVRTIDEWPARAVEARDHLLIQALGKLAAEAPQDPNQLIQYTSRAGVVSWRTRAEVENYTRGRRD